MSLVIDLAKPARRSASLLAALLTAFTFLAVGCKAPQKPYLDRLPDPVVHTLPRRPAPPTPPSPRPTARPRPIGPVTIVVDAGHGGKDPGARGVGPLPEKAVNLSVARMLMDMLRQRGAKVVASRTTDVFIPLDDRAALADQAHADLFVSIHADAAPRSSARGATVYIARDALPQSKQAAVHIATAFARAEIHCLGVRRAGFRVLVGHARPAVLIECGFLTNPVEAGRLCTAAYQQRVAAAVADGIADHFHP
jgi:N-acetylmuramoyl-L-alanine amidase